MVLQMVVSREPAAETRLELLFVIMLPGPPLSKLWVC